ncbi:MAG TPA: glycosyltransferase family 2 protein [Solirubrobacterales bacterium]
MSNAPAVAVVIPSWNCLQDLTACVESVRAQTAVELELFVVDNGSTDGTLGFLEDEGVRHVALPSNLGFAKAMNLGIARTGSPLVMALNADTTLEPGCLDRLAAALQADAALGGVQPLILQLERGTRRSPDDPEALVYSMGQALTRDGRGLEEGAGLRRGGASVERREIFGVCGAACLLRREMLVELGGYEERYFAFCEDVDLNVRAQAAGWRFDLEPSAVVWHVGRSAWSAGFARPEADNARLVARNRLATQIKFMPLRSTPRIAGVEAGALARAARGGRLRSTLSGKIEALGWLPSLIRERRRLRRSGEPGRARAWLGASAVGPPPG